MGDFLIILFDSRTSVIARDTFKDPNGGLLQIFIHVNLTSYKLTSYNLFVKYINVLYELIRVQMKFKVQMIVIKRNFLTVI